MEPNANQFKEGLDACEAADLGLSANEIAANWLAFWEGFARSWFNHTNEQAQSIGQRELMREAIALGLVVKPAKGQDVEFPFDTPEMYAQEITGKDVLVRTQLRAKRTKDGPVKDDEGNAVLEPSVVEWLAL